ncbi:MAG: hemolysin family protein [Candidatus Wallbacteria bacterium]
MSIFLFEIFLIFIMIILSGFLSMSEMAIISAKKNKLLQLSQKGDEGAEAAIKLIEEPEKFLSAIQVGITFIGIFTGVFGGATLEKILSVQIEKIELLKNYSEFIAISVVVIIITYFSILFGELIPKQIALNSPEGASIKISKPIQKLSFLAGPVVNFFAASTQLIMNILNLKKAKEASVTEEDIKIMIDQSVAEGELKKTEKDIIDRVFNLDDSDITQFMTHRTNVIWLNTEEDFAVNKNKILSNSYSYYPVCHGKFDDVSGIVSAKEFLAKLNNSNGHEFNYAKNLKQPLFIPESLTVLKVLELFKNSKAHIGLVTDEFGGISGIVTLNDLLEAIVGQFPGAAQPNDPKIVKRADSSYLIDGLISIDEVKPILKIVEFPHEDQYNTLSGFIMFKLGDIPKTGANFKWEDIYFEIVDMDGKRIDKVLVKLPENSGESMI